jgi:Lrp/AsnC family transcriptional regulator, leucine-responsive regulatory protein
LWRPKQGVAMSKTTAEHGKAIAARTAGRQIAGCRDEIDEKLLSLLRHNARLSLTALARGVALSRTAVQARISRLERDKVIVGYRAVLGERDREEVEGLAAVLSVTFSQRPCAPVVEMFRDWSEITNYYSVTGPVDAYVVVRVKDAQELSRFVDRLSALPGVGSVRSALVLRSDFD